MRKSERKISPTAKLKISKVYKPKLTPSTKYKDEIKILIKYFRIFAVGTLLLLVSITSAVALYSYYPLDVSWGTSSPNESYENLLGSMGAYWANFIYQFLGYTAYVISIIFIQWGGLILMRHKIQAWKTRLLLAITGLALLSSIFHYYSSNFYALWPQATSWLPSNTGGAIGYKVFNYIQSFQAIMPEKAFFFIIGGVTITALACLILSFGYTNQQLKSATFGIGLAGKKAAFFIYLSARFVIHALTILLKRAKYPQKKMEPKFQNQKRNRMDADISLFAHEDTFEEEPVLQENYMIETSTKTSSKSIMESFKEITAKKQAPTSVRLQNYDAPSLSLLTIEAQPAKDPELSKKSLDEKAEFLMGVLNDFGIKGKILGIQPGPVVTLYELEPAAGIKSSRIIGLADDIARSMSALSARVAVVPGRNVIGIELPNNTRETVFLKDTFMQAAYANTSASLPLCLGKDIAGNTVVTDLAKMPHLLVAGTTGSGKSVGVNSMILSLLFKLSPAECRFIMIDPKMLELSVYDGIPHLLSPVVTDPKKAIVALKWAVQEMQTRYRAMSQLNVRNISGYNEKIRNALQKGEILTRKVQTGFREETGEPIFEEQELSMTPLPFIVIVVDEMADLMMVAGKEIEAAVQRLAQMARAAGLHLIMATQRPSVDVITGTIKANFPTRIGFQVTSKIDSRTILGEQGAEQLLGRGDMLFMEPSGGRIRRVHGAFVKDSDVEEIVKHLKSTDAPEYIDVFSVSEDSLSISENTGDQSTSGDELYDKALSIILSEGKVSTSFIQRHLNIGYNRAAKIVEKLEKEGVISVPAYNGKREILVPHEKN